MPVTPGAVAALRGRVEALQRSRMEAEARARAAREEEARILREVEEEFEVTGLEAAEQKLAELEATLDNAYSALVGAVDEAEAHGASLPS